MQLCYINCYVGSHQYLYSSISCIPTSQIDENLFLIYCCMSDSVCCIYINCFICSMKSLTKLKLLNLSENSFTDFQLPTVVGELSSLEELHLENCVLKSLSSKYVYLYIYTYISIYVLNNLMSLLDTSFDRWLYCVLSLPKP